MPGSPLIPPVHMKVTFSLYIKYESQCFSLLLSHRIGPYSHGLIKRESMNLYSLISFHMSQPQSQHKIVHCLHKNVHNKEIRKQKCTKSNRPKENRHKLHPVLDSKPCGICSHQYPHEAVMVRQRGSVSVCQPLILSLFLSTSKTSSMGNLSQGVTAVIDSLSPCSVMVGMAICL